MGRFREGFGHNVVLVALAEEFAEDCVLGQQRQGLDVVPLFIVLESRRENKDLVKVTLVELEEVDNRRRLAAAFRGDESERERVLWQYVSVGNWKVMCVLGHGDGLDFQGLHLCARG